MKCGKYERRRRRRKGREKERTLTMRVSPVLFSNISKRS